MVMSSTTACPGCGVRLPESSWELDRSINASPECWQVYGELAGFELSDPSLSGRFHQLTVDAYGAQHAGGDTGAIRVAYGLVGLHLALDRGMRGVDVRAIHQRMGRPDAKWPSFPRPPDVGSLTVIDLVEAGARAGSVVGHADLVRRWAREVWDAWGAQHDDVAALADRFVAGRNQPFR
jgi:hypothetical protein